MSWNLSGAGLPALIAPILAHKLHYRGLLCLFAGLNIVSWTAIFFLVPETNRYSLEELYQICWVHRNLARGQRINADRDSFIVKVPTMTHVQYRIYRIKTLPGHLKWYLSRRGDKTNPTQVVLHHWAEEQKGNSRGNTMATAHATSFPLAKSIPWVF